MQAALVVLETHWYAQLDNDNMCVGISMLSGAVDSPALISIPGEDYSLLGQSYDRQSGTFVPPSPPEPTPAPVDPCEWLIDLGPFFDRFGVAKLPVLLSADPVVAAFLKDVNARKWVDLKRPDVAVAIDYMRGAAIPGIGTIGSPIAGLTADLQKSILETPVSSDENLPLRRLYFA